MAELSSALLTNVPTSSNDVSVGPSPISAPGPPTSVEVPVQVSLPLPPNVPISYVGAPSITIAGIIGDPNPPPPQMILNNDNSLKSFDTSNVAATLPWAPPNQFLRNCASCYPPSSIEMPYSARPVPPVPMPNSDSNSLQSFDTSNVEPSLPWAPPHQYLPQPASGYDPSLFPPHGYQPRFGSSSNTVAGSSEIIRSTTVGWESREAAESRIARMVAKQRQCYEKANMKVPEWLHADFLYRINYGPATREDVALAQRILVPKVDRKEREQITLLDRHLAAVLHKSMFRSRASEQLFCTDWTEAMESDERIELESKQGKLTPFDYPSLNDEIDPLLSCEDFTVNCVWSHSYASSILGTESRPPMAAVASDIISMLQYLKSVALWRETRPVVRWLQDLPRESILSIQGNNPVDWETGCHGFFFDLFRIAIARSVPGVGWDKKRDGKEIRLHQRILERTMYPGGDAVRLGRNPVNPTTLQGLYGSLEDMKASFICSGPFKLSLTTYPSEHLTLSRDREIRIYWEGSNQISASDIPGRQTFLRYKKHALGEELNAATIYDELVLTYSLLFSRDLASKKVAKELFAKEKMNVAFISEELIRPYHRSIIITEWDMHFYQRAPMLQDFQYYQGHFAVLQFEMAGWKPRTVREVLIPGYNDRFTWYATLLGLVIAGIGMIGIITSIAQTIVAFNAYTLQKTQ